MPAQPPSADTVIAAQLDRTGAAWPGLLHELVQAAHTADGAAVQRLAVDVPAAVARRWQAHAQAWPEHDAPDQQLHRLVASVLHAIDPQCPERHPAAVEQALPPGEPGLRLRLRSDWLVAAASALALAPAQIDTLPAATPDGTAANACSVRLLVQDADSGDGQFAVLRLRAVHAPGAHLLLVAAPGSAFTPCTASFAAAMDSATAMLRGQMPAAEAKDLALAWDIFIPGATLAGLDGPSAGAAVALAALWLLQDKLSPGPLRQALFKIDAWMLAHAGISAALHNNGDLDRVGGVPAKAIALRSVGAETDAVHLFAHASNCDELGAYRIPRLALHPVASLRQLAQALPSAMAPDPARQAVLASLPLDSPMADPADDQAAPPAAPPKALEQVLGQHKAVRSLVDYALQRWATWAAQQGGALHLRFVPLRLARLASGTVADSSAQALPAGPFTGLVQLLRELQAPDRDDPPLALLLRGGPGAGKSTLLQRHEQGLALDFLRHWHQRRAGTAAHADVELPLYVPLAALPADAHPLHWLHDHLRQHYPACTDLHQLLLHGQRPPGHPGVRLRLLLDGLNELPTPPGRTRVQRAEQVLAVLQKELPQPLLPPLLCTRSQHGFDTFLQSSHGRQALAVDVLDWDDAHIDRYVQRRFGPGSATATALLQALADNPQARELCRIPFNADGQCTLWQASRRLVTHRAALYARLLRQALVRELRLKPGTQQPVNPLFYDHPALLTDADRNALLDDDAWQADPPPPWPTQGALLPALFRQALAQWLQAGEGGAALPAKDRGQVQVPWDDPDDLDDTVDLDDTGAPDRPAHPQRSVAHWLAPGLRQLWHDAVRDLGLLAPQAPGANAFRFRHQSWGEYLASVTLLTPTPQAMPPAQRQHLLGRLRAGRGFERSALAELAYQRAQADARWREPGDAFWQALLHQPLQLPLSAVLAALGRDGYTPAQLRFDPAQPPAAMTNWQRAQSRGAVRVDEGQDRCTCHLGAWGDLFDIAGRSGLDGPQAPAWRTAPAAWRVLVLQSLLPPWRQRVFDLIGDQIGDEAAQRLRQADGGLALQPVADLDEVLGLALLGLADPSRWLVWLLQHGLWAALQPLLADLQGRLEGAPDKAWPADGRSGLHPVLQHLRRVLLLRSLDAGPDARPAVEVSGQWALLHAPLPPAHGLPGKLQAEVEQHWADELKQAFGIDPLGQPGRDLRQRLQAAQMLGTLGDNLRYERAQAATGWGLRLKAALWAPVGRPGHTTTFTLGSARGDTPVWADEQPASPLPLPHLGAARLPLTCSEWRRFVAAQGYADPQAAHWQAAGPAAQGWLAGLPDAASYRPPALDRADWGQALNPITTLTAFEAVAYAAWAAPMYGGATPGLAAPVLQVPTEAAWEAAQRAGPDGLPQASQARWLHLPAGTQPGALDFNHAATGWNRPSPVGVFSTAYSAAGLADGMGNVWEWCCNSLPQGPQPYGEPGSLQAAQSPWAGGDRDSPRALRGGAYGNPSDRCRPAVRLHGSPGDHDSGIGVRLVRV